MSYDEITIICDHGGEREPVTIEKLRRETAEEAEDRTPGWLFWQYACRQESRGDRKDGRERLGNGRPAAPTSARSLDDEWTPLGFADEIGALLSEPTVRYRCPECARSTDADVEKMRLVATLLESAGLHRIPLVQLSRALGSVSPG